MEEVTVTFNPDGTAVIETKGFTGSACRDATADLKKALGGEILEDEDTFEARSSGPATASVDRLRSR